MHVVCLIDLFECRLHLGLFDRYCLGHLCFVGFVILQEMSVMAMKAAREQIHLWRSAAVVMAKTTVSRKKASWMTGSSPLAYLVARAYAVLLPRC